MRFEPAPEYQVFPTRERPLKPYEAAVRAARETQPLIADVDPEIVVADILTVAAGLAAEMAERRWATLIPHVMPISEPGFPPYSIGARLPRTPVGLGTLARARPDRPVGDRARQGRAERDTAPPRPACVRARARRDLARARARGDLSAARISADVVVEMGSGDGAASVRAPGRGRRAAARATTRSILVAPSTSQDRKQRMLRAALVGLADEPVRVLATTNVRGYPIGDLPVPANARVVDWLSYTRTMPHCAAVVCHAGHGTVVRALANGVPLVACPAAGDMAENAARVSWAGAGVSLPRRLVTERGIRLAVRRLLSEPELRDPSARPRYMGRVATMAPSTQRELWKRSSGGGTRTHNPSINSRMLCH